MKKIALCLMAAAFAFTGCTKKDEGKKPGKINFAKPGVIKIGIAKIVQHPALDSIEQGIQDRLKELGINAEYNLQNANGDVNTASQIAGLFKTQKMDINVGIATPVAVALANTIKDKPVLFSCITDPVVAGLVEDVSKGYKNVTGLSDAIPTEQHIALFKEIAGIKTLGYIYTSSEANSQAGLDLVKKGCEQAGIELVTQAISSSVEVKQAAESIISRVDGLYLTTDNTVFSALSSLVNVFNRAHKPIFSGDVTGAQAGGIFMASGFNYYKAGLVTGDMIVELINGKKPEEMPVKFITKPEDSDLLFDLDVAKDCGINIPQNYLDSANMIFQNGKLTAK